jgi:hypothetical protein
MPKNVNQVDVYLEIGRTRVFAVLPDWPGWCRSGREESSALQSLMDYGPRYASALGSRQIAFLPPASISELAVAGRLAGNATTDFGAPSLTLPGDTLPLPSTELQRYQEILRACWDAFDSAARMATGCELRKGPRGGGRDLAKVIQHVFDVDVAYLGSLGGKTAPAAGGGLEQA